MIQVFVTNHAEYRPRIDRLTESSSAPEAQASCNQTQHEYQAKDSDPFQVHGQRRHDRAKTQCKENSGCCKDNGIIPPAPPLVSAAELVASLSHHGSMVVQAIAIALSQHRFIRRAVLFRRGYRCAA